MLLHEDITMEFLVLFFVYFLINLLDFAGVT